ncbi:MAG: VanW family protein [Patescibacteria group bacterium]
MNPIIKEEKIENKIGKNKKRRWLIILAIFLFVIIILGSGIFYISSAIGADKFYPGVKIGSLAVGNKTKSAIWQELNTLEQNLQKNNLIFTAEGKQFKVELITATDSSPDLARLVLTFDWQKTIDLAYQIGRQGSWNQKITSQLETLLFGKSIPVSYTLDEQILTAVLKNKLSQLEKPPVNALLQFTNNQAEVITEKSGYIFDYQKAISELKTNINSLDFKAIDLNLVFTEPEIKKSEAIKLLPNLSSILATSSIKLIAEGQSWKLEEKTLQNWLEFQIQDGQIVIGLNKEKVFKFFEPISQTINVEAKDAKLQIKDGKITEFQATQDGKQLNLEQNYKILNDQIIAGILKDTELIVEVTKAKTLDENVNNLGIKELIGQGKSNFAGSPKNRRINIAVGAKTLNGILIAPGEEFSVIKALGAIDGEHGYKQELVIKGDRTIPEYGGGLCQIGTTAFRVALNSGLPITERRSHSYRVVYYEPAGLDATIYDPAPDLKFINDTGNYILFATKISGDNLIFDFYGTKDGRQVKFEPDVPRIYNVTSPGPKKEIVSTDLKPGEKKKVESAHKGADTFFKYIVTYPDGTVKEKDFPSHYVPWPEVWLIGATATTTSETSGGTDTTLPTDILPNTQPAPTVATPTPPTTN